jgi:chemotaxis protein MotB
MLDNDLLKDDGLDFNFWPSFTDLMLTITIIMAALLVVKFGVSASDLKQKQESKVAIISEIKNQLKLKFKENYRELKESENTLIISNGNENIVKITSETDYQQISFYEKILFDRSQFSIKNSGREVLQIVGDAIKLKSNNIKLVQIEGHTDSNDIKLDNYPKNMGNIVLGSRRAVDVYQFFKDQVGIDPAVLPMSATTFGEYAPPSRKLDSSYNRELLVRANSTEELKASNRRIELKLFFSSK